jgi:hypothetical protein
MRNEIDKINYKISFKLYHYLLNLFVGNKRNIT